AAAGIVIGGRPVGPMDIDLRWVGGVMYRNSEIEETGVSAGVLGRPALGIAWLANKLAPFGGVLEPGNIMLSGSFIRPVWAEKGDTLHADFGPLGGVAVGVVWARGPLSGAVVGGGGVRASVPQPPRAALEVGGAQAGAPGP